MRMLEPYLVHDFGTDPSGNMYIPLRKPERKRMPVYTGLPKVWVDAVLCS